MKNPRKAGWWSHTTGWAAAVVTLTASLAVAPSIARAACVGDCNNSGTVTIDELVLGIDINLGTMPLTACSNASSNGTTVLVNDNVTAVNNALHGCASAVCGDGITQSGEDCDPGSICIGGDNAGTVCTKESDCMGDGVCDTFGQKGPPGTVPRKVCSGDDECGGAKCIHCKAFSANGCAANCTTEMASRIKLVPGVFGAGGGQAGTSYATVNASLVPNGLTLLLNGINTVRSGSKPSANGTIPLAQRRDDANLPRIPITTLSCACVRGVVYKTCGGTQYEQDGVTESTNCTDVDTCAQSGKPPCAPVAGPGNSSEGVIGCTGLPSASYSIEQDAGGEMCPDGVVPCDKAGPAIYMPGPAGAAGSEILAAASGIGTVMGQCKCVGCSNPGDYGTDGQFCTNDDPFSPPDLRGIPSIVTLVSGEATVTLNNVNGDGDSFGPFSIDGTAKSCEDVAAGNTAGAAQAGAFTAAGPTRNRTLGDTANVNIFVAQCTLPADPTVISCCADPVAGCCGNGRQESSETCDDGNSLACGTCNATCSGAGSGKCPPGSGCNSDAVCDTGLCVAGVCEADHG
ncbi:MAG TPA: hypothetical protein VMW56_07415 [Candidatus Margulisiibacteriota bacterium]|nr:hypothetical protein [Candidatus Margulisiibacteriota bacterium]